jgi:transmembrane sensor
MARHKPEHDPISSRAVFWSARLNDNDLSDAEREEMQAWLLGDPRRADEFRAHNALIHLAHEFPPDIQARLNQFIPAARVEPATPRRWWAFAAAAALVAVVTGMWLNLRPTTYTTSTGENRAVPLADGSVAYMNTRSIVEWLKGEDQRRARLREGEVMFDVSHDPAHPFRLLVDNNEIQVLGTRFNVYRKPAGEITVTVVEGQIRVRGLQQGESTPWERVLNKNQDIVYDSQHLISDVRDVPVGSGVQWRAHVLEIPNMTVGQVLDELGRYTDRPITVRDPRVKELHAVGVVPTNDLPAAFGRLKKLVPQLHVERSGDAFVLDYETKNDIKEEKP